MVRIVFLHYVRAAVLMLILTSAVSHAVANSLKTLPAQIDVYIVWNINENFVHKKGSLLMQITGTMELKPGSVQTPGGQALVPVMLRYSADGLTGYYNFQETETNKDGKQTCSHSGSASLTAARIGLMRVNRMKHLASPNISKLAPNQIQYFNQIPGQELLLDYYDFSCGFAAQPSKVSGMCGEKPSKKSIYVGSMLLGFKIPDSGEMKGHRNWTASTIRNFSLSDLPERMGRPAYKPESPGGSVTYNVTWAFGDAIKPIDVEVETVSFKYNNQDKKSLQLLHHAPKQPVKSPEWNSGGKNQPAAFVRDYRFPVKVVFKCKRPVEAAEIHAIEEVIENQGSGFGGKLEKERDLTITDDQISGEFFIKTAPKVNGTHMVKWIWKGKIKFKDEPKKIEMHLGTSKHTIHIVGAEPTNNTNAYKYAAELGCEWAKGTVGGNQALDAIWGSFWNIPPPKDCPSQDYLSYKHKKGLEGTTDELLTKGREGCGAWADFFKDTVGIHGIEIEKIGVYPKNAGMTIPGEICFDNIVVKEGPAQGNKKPSRIFTEHILNKYNGFYFDPSYGKKMPDSLNEYENKMFLGYCRSAEAIVEINQNKHKCGNFDPLDPSQRQALVADCLIKTDDDGTACVPNRLDECEVEERPVWP